MSHRENMYRTEHMYLSHVARQTYLTGVIYTAGVHIFFFYMKGMGTCHEQEIFYKKVREVIRSWPI